MLNQELIQQELIQRELARKSLLACVQRFEPTYLAGWVHKDICARLEKFIADVRAKRSPRLLLMLPPRSGKSLLASIYFPAWYLGLHPRDEVILTSYAASLALSFSRRIREVVRDPSYVSVFETTKLHPDAQSAENWMTTYGGSLLAAGVGGPITGRGAHVLIVDDPVKNAEEAESESMREATWRWFTSTAYTRLAPGGGVLAIGTRWHGDDLLGRLEERGPEGDGDVYEVVRYPAVATEDEPHRKEGEALHPERYSLVALRAIERAVGPRVWNALYQQTPVPEQGGYFQREDIRWYDEEDLPGTLTYYGACDLAISKRERSNYTAALVAGMDEDGDLWLVDGRRKRMDAFEIVEMLLDLWEEWRPEMMGIEEGMLKAALGPYLEVRVQERRAFSFTPTPLPPGRRDKEARGRSIQGLLQRNKVHFPREAPWASDLVTEMMQFPFGTYDDMVDALAWLGVLVTEMDPPTVKKQKEETQSWRDKLKAFRSLSGMRTWRAA